MNVLHISLSDIRGGASIAAYRQHRALIGAGVDSRMLVAFKESHDDTVELYMRPQDNLKKTKRLVDRVRFDYRKRYRLRYDRVFNQAFSFPDSVMPFKWPEISSHTDVVNIHMASGFLHLKKFIGSIPAEIPLVFTMHDMNAFTGGCHYSFECERFVSGCGNCPFLNSPSRNDLSSKISRIKKRAYDGRPKEKIVFVGDSRWIEQQAKKSSLLSGMTTRVIHYGVDIDIFKPIDKSLAKHALGIPPGVKTILFVSENINDPRKGFSLLVDAFGKMKQRDHVRLLSVGRNPPTLIAGLPSIHFGMIQNERFLSLIYNTADVFVAPSVYEAFGQTALEAQSCGVPVVAFDTGGLKDIVEHQKTGLLCDWKSVEGLAQAMDRLLNEDRLRLDYGKNARLMTETGFSMEKNAREYMGLYHQLINGDSGG